MYMEKQIVRSWHSVAWLTVRCSSHLVLANNGTWGSVESRAAMNITMCDIRGHASAPLVARPGQGALPRAGRAKDEARPTWSESHVALFINNTVTVKSALQI